MSDEGKSYLKVIQYIRRQLLCDQLHLGDKLPSERELSGKLGLSRNSIREALRTMENMGIVESRQGSGNYLTGNVGKSFTDSLSMMVLMKQVSYLEINQLRRAVEMQSLLLAMNRITNDELAKIDHILTKIDHATGDERTLYDKEFHDAITEASGNELMVSVMQALSATCKEVIDHVLSQETDGNKQLLMQSHRRIYEGLLNKDLRLAMESVNTHYNIIDNRLQTKKS